MEMENINQLMAQFMMVNGKKILCMDLVFINGMMECYIKEIGKKIKWMEMEYNKFILK